ncbi:MAG: LamG domain-containing protein, partial [Planctomycetes bacterium]|nr:LamG domain-containing protein [Planctomycetota bacterium]
MPPSFGATSAACRASAVCGSCSRRKCNGRRNMRIRTTSILLALILTGSGCKTMGRDGAKRLDSDSLVAHWTFDEGSGDVARDVTGNGHDAALKNVEWVRSPRGYALRFDSKDDLAQYGNIETMMLSGDTTLAVWVKTDASVAPNTHRLIFGDVGYAVMRNGNLAVDSYQRLSFEWGDGKSAASVLAPGTLMNGAWKHVVAVADSTAMRATLYVDGAVAAEMPMPMPITKTTARERITGWFYNGYFQGDLDDVRLYARSLSEAEVKRLFTSQADVQVGQPVVRFDAAQPEPRGLVSVTVRNWSKEPRLVEVSSSALPKREMELPPGAEVEATLGEVKLKPVWRGRNDLFICEQSAAADKASIVVHRGELTERMPLAAAPQLAVEPIQVRLKDPWQRTMPTGRTKRLELDVQFAIPAEQLRQGTLRVRLISRETGQEALRRQVEATRREDSHRVESPTAAMPLT